MIFLCASWWQQLLLFYYLWFHLIHSVINADIYNAIVRCVCVCVREHFRRLFVGYVLYIIVVVISDGIVKTNTSLWGEIFQFEHRNDIDLLNQCLSIGSILVWMWCFQAMPLTHTHTHTTNGATIIDLILMLELKFSSQLRRPFWNWFLWAFSVGCCCISSLQRNRVLRQQQNVPYIKFGFVFASHC